MKMNFFQTHLDLEALKAFHGHLGPYLVAGARMGLIANMELSSHKLEKYCIVRCSTPPMSCLIDGIQFISGCTYGTGRIIATSEGIPEAFFTYKEKELRIKLIKPFEFKGEGIHELEDYVNEFLKKSDEEVLEVTSNFTLTEFPLI
jgi:formylmethanofuran dehydrogenase subunit E